MTEQRKCIEGKVVLECSQADSWQLTSEYRARISGNLLSAQIETSFGHQRKILVSVALADCHDPFDVLEIDSICERNALKLLQVGFLQQVSAYG